MSTVTTHVLDTSLGQPAAGVPVAWSTWPRHRSDPLAPAYPGV
jgi:5-hydroxyisourate hydrolase-like protein (transthyretin family)